MIASESALLRCSPEEAWSYLIDWERQAEWMGDADRITVVGRREGVGVRLRVRTRLYNVPAFTETLEVTGWDPPRRLTIAHRSLVKGEGEWVLRPESEGTRFIWTEDVTLPVVGDLVAGIYRPFLRRVMRRSMRALQAGLSPSAR